MKKLRHIIVPAIAILASAAMTVPAAAKPAHAKGKGKPHKVEQPVSPMFAPSFLPQERTQLPKWADQRISYSKAKSIARSRYPGAEVVDIKLNGETYRVRMVLQNGRIVDVLIDAASGRIR